MNRRLFWRLAAPHTRQGVMAWLTIIGVAVGVATLLVTLSILDGFASAYRDGLIRFNAPVVVMRDDEKVDQATVEQTFNRFAATHAETDRTELATIKWANRLRDLSWYLNWRYARLAMQFREVPWLHDALSWAAPRRIVNDTSWPEALVTRRDQWQAKVRNMASRGITAQSPFLYREGLMLGQGNIRGVVLRGIEPAQALQVNTMQLTLTEGANDLTQALQPTDAEAIPIVIGSALAEQVGHEGVHLFLPGAGEAASGAIDTAGQTYPVRVVGTFSSGLYEFDAQFAFLHLATLQKLYGKPGVVTGYELQVDNVDKAPWIAEALSMELGPDYTVRDWRETHRETFEAVAIEKVLFGLIMGLLVLVASFNIITTMLLRILQRYKTVAILTSVGMTQRQARRIFFWQGSLLGSIGIIAGLLLGSLVAWGLGTFEWINIAPEIYFLTRLPTSLNGTTMLIITVFGLCTVTFAAARAARRVSKLPILEALGRGYL